MSGTEYSDFLEKNGVTRFMFIEGCGVIRPLLVQLYEPVKKQDDAENMYNYMREAIHYATDSEIPSAYKKESIPFLATEIPAVVDKLLSLYEEKALAEACFLTDRFDFLFHFFEYGNTRAYLHKECARVALNQEEYAVALRHGREAGLAATEVIEADWQKKYYDEAVEFRRDAVNILCWVAENTQGEISSDAALAAFSFDFSGTCGSPVRSHRHATGTRNVPANDKF